MELQGELLQLAIDWLEDVLSIVKTEKPLERPRNMVRDCGDFQFQGLVEEEPLINKRAVEEQ